MDIASHQKIVKSTTAIPRPVGNGHANGHSAELIKGRGIRHRKASPSQRVHFAADVAVGAKRVELSNGQLCDLFEISPVALRDELQRRAATSGNGNDEPDLAAMAIELVARLGLDGAFDLLVEVTER